MSAIALRLQHTLASLDPADATLLERLVNDALALVSRRSGKPVEMPVDANGWPVGHFEKYAGIFANEPFDMPVDVNGWPAGYFEATAGAFSNEPFVRPTQERPFCDIPRRTD